MFTDILSQLEHVKTRIKQSELLLEPWPHLYITEFFSPDYYRKVCEYENDTNLECIDEYGRKEYKMADHHPAIKDVEAFTSEIFYSLCDKLCEEYHDVVVPATTSFWKDTSDLSITDVHVDAFYDTEFTISGQLYLSKDIDKKHYGTRLYSYIGNNIIDDAIQDPGTAHPHIAKHDKLDNFKLVRTVPYYPNCMLVTTNHPRSWHQAPNNIVEGDVRDSLMWRWKV